MGSPTLPTKQLVRLQELPTSPTTRFQKISSGTHHQSTLRKGEGDACSARHLNESIIIGDDIVITVVDIRGDKVRLGINAPVQIPVHRWEVYQAIQLENQRTAQAERAAQASVPTLGAERTEHVSADAKEE